MITRGNRRTCSHRLGLERQQYRAVVLLVLVMAASGSLATMHQSRTATQGEAACPENHASRAVVPHRVASGMSEGESGLVGAAVVSSKR